jgi:[ribosomal protein S5]-alanine N-acetyltransferase
MPISLHQISLSELHELAASRIPTTLLSRVEPEALPPKFVAARALQHIALGKSLSWCSTFYIVRDSDNKIIGSCGFKNVPVEGCVGIGYGISPGCRGQGAATAAVEMLLAIAFKAGVERVLAEVNPANFASTRVVEKLDFKKSGMRVDEGNELLVQWVKQSTG